MLSFNYIMSQVLIIIAYILMCATFYVKNRKLILLLGNFSTLSFALSYLFLFAWSGVIMNVLSLIRNLVFLIQDKYSKNRDKITWIDWIILAAFNIMFVIAAVFTYAGFLSLMSVFATCLFTVAVWQKSPKVYRLLGCFASVLWIIYNIFVFSIFGIILECVLLVCAIIGTIKAYKTNLNSSIEKQ